MGKIVKELFSALKSRFNCNSTAQQGSQEKHAEVYRTVSEDERKKIVASLDKIGKEYRSSIEYLADR